MKLYLVRHGEAVPKTRDPEQPLSATRLAIRNFSFAFFIPVYFAIVGLRLNLLRDFDPIFFVGFLAFACAIKSASVYAGARLAGELRSSARNLAVAMNARGGPGIVLASVAYDARIINEHFYASLVMLAIVTSLLAGAWLQRVIESGRSLRGTASTDEGEALATGTMNSQREHP